MTALAFHLSAIVLTITITGAALYEIPGLFRHLLGPAHADGVICVVAARIAQLAALGVGLSFLIGVLGVPLAPVVGTGTLSMAAVFAFQSYLQNIQAGITLQAEGYLRRGAAISFGPYVGIVIELRARAAILETSAGDIVPIPYTQLQSNPFAVHLPQKQEKAPCTSPSTQR